MTRAPAPARRRRLFGSVRATHIALALLFGLAAAAAFALMARSSESALRAEIDAELRAISRQHALRGLISVGDAIEFRALYAKESDAAAAYLMVRSNGSKLVGNLERWPEGHTDDEGWMSFDGSAAGVAPGRLLARSTRFNGHRVLVGRRFALGALGQRFALAFAALAAAAIGIAVIATRRSERAFRARIAELNAVLESAERGSIEGRRAGENASDGDELASLGRHIDAALDEIERLVKGLDAVSHTAAHELNRELARLRDEARASGAERFALATDEVLALLGEILELSKLEARPKLTERVDLRRALARVESLYADSFEAADVSLDIAFEGEGEALVRGSEPVLVRALANLVENALKHSPPGARVRVTLAKRERAIAIEVRDEGPGAPSEDPSVLEALGARGSAGGHGFGLRVVRAVAIRHGGDLELRNLHPGFEATLSLPR